MSTPTPSVWAWSYRSSQGATPAKLTMPSHGHPVLDSTSFPHIVDLILDFFIGDKESPLPAIIALRGLAKHTRKAVDKWLAFRPPHGNAASLCKVGDTTVLSILRAAPQGSRGNRTSLKRISARLEYQRSSCASTGPNSVPPGPRVSVLRMIGPVGNIPSSGIRILSCRWLTASTHPRS